MDLNSHLTVNATLQKKVKAKYTWTNISWKQYSNNSISYWTQIKQNKISDGLEKDPCLKLA